MIKGFLPLTNEQLAMLSNPDTYRCQTCRSAGFEPSILGPARCTYCDGTFAGVPPTLAEVEQAENDRRIAAAADLSQLK